MILAIPCQETINAEGVANLYLQQVFPHFRLPSKVNSDRDPQFVSQFMKEICHLLGITQNISTAYHPWTDGQEERTNQWIEQYLQFWVNHQQDNWNHYLPLAEFAHNSWPNETTKQTPFEALKGYTPRAEIFNVTSSLPTVALQMEIWKKARRVADKMIIKAQKQWMQSKNPPKTYQDGDLAWLEGCNLHLDQPAVKLSPKHHGPFKVTRVLSPITYQLELPSQWKIHNVFHINLLTPYHETDIHGPNFTQPPPDLINGQEEYKVKEILDSRKWGWGCKVQYLVKWKGYPSSDNQWVNWDGMHAEEEALANFRKQQPGTISHIKRGKAKEQDPSSLMQSNASAVSPTLLASPASSTISSPFIPNVFSMEGQGIKATVAEAFLSWCPQVPSSWQTPSPSKSEGTGSNKVNSDDGSSIIFRASGEHACAEMRNDLTDYARTGRRPGGLCLTSLRGPRLTDNFWTRTLVSLRYLLGLTLTHSIVTRIPLVSSTSVLSPKSRVHSHFSLPTLLPRFPLFLPFDFLDLFFILFPSPTITNLPLFPDLMMMFPCDALMHSYDTLWLLMLHTLLIKQLSVV